MGIYSSRKGKDETEGQRHLVSLGRKRGGTQQFDKGRYIATRHLSHRSSHAMTHRIFGDTEERKQGERKRRLPRETTA